MSSREGNGTPLQYSCLENPMGGGAWYAAVHGVAKSRAWLSDFTFSFHFHALEKEMATHSSVLDWRIPETGEPGGLLSMGSHRVGHDWSDLAAAAAAAVMSSVTCSLPRMALLWRWKSICQLNLSEWTLVLLQDPGTAFCITLLQAGLAWQSGQNTEGGELKEK